MCPVAQLSNAVVQPASMLAKPSSMLAQLRVWIGYGSDLVFECRPDTSSTARFSKDAGRPETRVENFKTRVENPSNPGSKIVRPWFRPWFRRFDPGFDPGFDGSTLDSTWQTRVEKLFDPGFGRLDPGFDPGFGVDPGFSTLVSTFRPWFGAPNPGSKQLTLRA